MIEVHVHGEEELRRVADRLDLAPRRLQRELGQGVRQAARPAIEDLKASIRGADVSGRRAGGKPFTARIASKGLRGPMARAAQVKVEISGDPKAVFTVREDEVPPRIRTLVRFVVGNAQRWRHPIMGKRGRWASQNAPNVFWKTLRPHLAAFNRAIRDAVDTVDRWIDS